MSRKNRKNRGMQPPRPSLLEEYRERPCWQQLQEAMQGEMKKRAVECFAQAPVPVRLLVVSTSLYGRYRDINLQVICTFDYHGLNASRTVRDPLNLTLPEDSPMEKRIEELDQQLNDRVGREADRMFQGIPLSWDSDKPGLLSCHPFFDRVVPMPEKFSLGKRTLPQVVEEVFRRLEPKLKEAVEEQLNAALTARADSLHLPEWVKRSVFPAVLTGCSLEVRLEDDYTLNTRCTFQVRYQEEESIPAEAGGSGLFRAARTLPEAELETWLEDCLTKQFRKAEKKAEKSIPCAGILPSSGFFPYGVETMLESAEGDFGTLKIRWEGKGLTRGASLGSRFLGIMEGNTYVIMPDVRADGHYRKSFTFDWAFWETCQREPEKALNTLTGLGTLEEAVSFGGAASALFDSMSVPEGGIRPELTFFLSPNIPPSCRWHGMFIDLEQDLSPSLSAPGTLAARTRAVLRSFLDRENSFQGERQAQLDVYATLNPSQLMVLKYIYQSGRTWFHDVADYLESRSLTTKAAVGRYLDELKELKVPVLGQEEPVILWSWVEGRHGRFQLYQPNPKVSGEILACASPRPFRADESGDFTPRGREVWFQSLVKEARTPEKRWRVVEILENTLPRTQAVAFVRSPEGQTFLREFTGPDRTYVRFLLESLPGCHRLAAELFGQDEQEESGDADG